MTSNARSDLSNSSSLVDNDSTDEKKARHYAASVDVAANANPYNVFNTGSMSENLASYLQQPYERNRHQPATRLREQRRESNFATLHHLSTTGPSQVLEFESIAAFNKATRPWPPTEPFAHVLFMRGNPSPDWLNAIGAKYDLDFQFFNSHLDFRISTGKANMFVSPSLPSACALLPRLCTTTIGASINEGARERASSQYVDSLRSANDDHMKEYFALIKANKDELAVAESIVRFFSTHDESHCSFEQDISMCATACGKGWICKQYPFLYI